MGCSLLAIVETKSVILHTNPSPKAEIMIWLDVVEHAELCMFVETKVPVFEFDDPVKRAVRLEEHLRIFRCFAFPWTGGRMSVHRVLLSHIG